MDNEFINSRITPNYQPLATRLLMQCSWDWAKPRFSNQALLDYQLFLLCKVVGMDIEPEFGQSRCILSPTVEVDEVWHEHMLYPQHYVAMCEVLLLNEEKELRVDYSSTPSTKKIPCVLFHDPKAAQDPEPVKQTRRNRAKALLESIVLADRKKKLVSEDDATKPIAMKHKICATSPTVGQRKRRVTETLYPIYVVKSGTGKTDTLSVYSSDLIEEVKRKYQVVSGIPVDQMRFIFAGIQLQDDRSLGDYNILAKSSVHVILILRG